VRKEPRSGKFDSPRAGDVIGFQAGRRISVYSRIVGSHAVVQFKQAGLQPPRRLRPSQSKRSVALMQLPTTKSKDTHIQSVPSASS
jgi:hypothetical protein